MLDEMGRPIVYVSYSHTKEEKSGLLEAIKIGLPDINFRIDNEYLSNRDNFLDFIKEISEADYILVFFSKNYFKSFYCMLELTSIMLNGGDIKDRVFTIRDDDYPLKNKIKSIKAYWAKMAKLGADAFDEEYLNAYGKTEEVVEILNQLDNVFDQFVTKLAPAGKELIPTTTFQALQGSVFQPIRDWLKEVLPAIELDKRVCQADNEFCIDVQNDIENILVLYPILFESIKRQMSLDKGIDESFLAHKLCTYKDKRALVSPMLFKACQSAVLKTKRMERVEEKQELVEKIENLVNLLAMLAIDGQFVEGERQKNGYVINLHVHTTFGQVFTASRFGQVAPDIEIKGHKDFRGKYELNPLKPGACINKGDVIVNEMLVYIANQVYHDDPGYVDKEPGYILTDAERKSLNEDIKLHGENGTRHYYCMLRPQASNPPIFDNESLISKLITLLPALDVFRAKDSVGNIVFVTTDESRLSDAYVQFINALKKW